MLVQVMMCAVMLDAKCCATENETPSLLLGIGKALGGGMDRLDHHPLSRSLSCPVPEVFGSDGSLEGHQVRGTRTWSDSDTLLHVWWPLTSKLCFKTAVKHDLA